MRNRIWTALIAGLASVFVAGPGAAQGYAGLGSTAEGFAQPERGRPLAFPADHGVHPGFRTEWWYLTANLTGPDGTPYGLQWTLFRSALAPPTDTGAGTATDPEAGWASPQIWMGHAAVTTPQAHHSAERFARGGIGQAGARAAPFDAWIDEWRMQGQPGLDRVRLTASGADFAYQATLTAEGPLVAHGEAGYSVKSTAGHASHYYSQPFFRVEGRLTLPEGEVPVTGTAWLDREWFSQLLEGDQAGWDWFALNFEGGARLMGFLLRTEGRPPYSAATWIAPDGTATAFPDGAFQAEPLARHTVAGRSVPVDWRVRLPAKGVDVTVAALNPDAWMPMTFPYWEGPVRVSGSHAGTGYLEMTGYD